MVRTKIPKNKGGKRHKSINPLPIKLTKTNRLISDRTRKRMKREKYNSWQKSRSK